MTDSEVRRRPGGRSAQVHIAVITAALELLAERGPGGFTVAEVAKRAGVHETSIYRRWGTRERVILDAMSQLSSEQIPVPDTGSLRGDLVALGRTLVEYVESPLGQALTRTLAVTDDDEDAADVRARFWDARYAECGVIVERAAAIGEVPATADGRMLLETFIAPIHLRLLLSRQDVTDDFLRVLADVVVQGVALSATSATSQPVGTDL